MTSRVGPVPCVLKFMSHVINQRLSLRMSHVINQRPTKPVGLSTSWHCETSQTLFCAGAYTASDKRPARK